VFRNADAGRFGPWSYLAPLRREDGSLAGRCAAVSTDFFFMGGRMGVGVVKGLRAGEVEGLAGVVVVQTQSDLARNSAIPDISLSTLQKWAQGEKHLLLGQAWPVENDPFNSLMAIFGPGHVQIDDKLCGILAAYGSDHTNLILGKLGGEEITMDKLVTRLSDTTELFVTEGEVEYDEDDEVLPKDFRKYFEPDTWLLELAPTRSPRWLNKIDDGSLSHKTWSLEAALAGALNQAWGDVEWTEEKCLVGEVKGCPIVRESRVARPIPQQEDRS